MAIARNPRSREIRDALRLGADEVIISTNPEEMEQHAGTFDFIQQNYKFITTVTTDQVDGILKKYGYGDTK